MGSAVDELGRREFWLAMNPELSITDRPNRDHAGPTSRLGGIDAAALRGSLRQRGYFHSEAAIDHAPCAPLARAMARLVEAGIPTPFLFVYDEVWQLLERSAVVLEELMGPGFLVGGDLWAWHVAADAQASGWAVHRDANIDGMLPDGSVGLITVWIPLTDANPANGCMYVLPTDRDPFVPDQLDRREVSPADLASVRALPAGPGDVLGWSTQLLHWGGRSSDDATAARMSLSIYGQRDDVPRYRDDFVRLDGAIPLHYRLGMVGRALLAYESSGLSGTEISDDMRRFAEDRHQRLAKWLQMMAALQPS